MKRRERVFSISAIEKLPYWRLTKVNYVDRIETERTYDRIMMNHKLMVSVGYGTEDGGKVE